MGIVYLIQPGYCEGTCRYKIGMSNKNNLNRISKGYPVNTSIYHIVGSLANPREVEQKVIQEFNNKYEKSACGQEYFEGNIYDMVDTFIHIVNKHRIIETTQTKLNDDDMLLFMDFFKSNFISTPDQPQNRLMYQEVSDCFKIWYRLIYDIRFTNTTLEILCSKLKLFICTYLNIKCNSTGYVGIANNPKCILDMSD